MSYFFSFPLISEPGYGYAYSTFSYNLAAVTLEKATGKSFFELVKEKITGPLGLCSIQPDYSAWTTYARQAAVFGSTNSDTRDDDVSYKLAGGGWIGTADDFVKYGNALLSDFTWMPDAIRYGTPNGLWVNNAA